MLTTHYMDEAEQLCDRLVIMDRGRIVAEGSPRELIEQHATREVVELRFATDEDRDKALALAAETGDRVEAVGDRLVVYTRDGDAAAERLSGNGVRPEATMVRRSHARGRVPDPHRPLARRERRDEHGRSPCAPWSERCTCSGGSGAAP